MADPYSGDFYFEPGIIKQEPYVILEGSQLTTSASMPIPARRAVGMSELREYGFDLEGLDSPQRDTSSGSSGALQTGSGVFQALGGNAMWGTRATTNDSDIIQSDDLKMDDDDIFQVDKADLIQGPTLAELNANDDTLLENFNFDDLLLPDENTYLINTSSQLKYPTPCVQITNLGSFTIFNNNSPSPSGFTPSSYPQSGLGYYRDTTEPSSSVPSSPFDPFSPKSSVAAFSPTSQHSSTSSLLQNSVSPPPAPLTVMRPQQQQRHSTLHELLLKRDAGTTGRSVPSQTSGSSGLVMRTGRVHSSRLSSSAPTHLGLDQIWQRREPRKHLLSTGSLAEATGSTSSLSTGGVLSPEPADFSHDEESDEDSDHYEDFSTDNDSDDDGSRRSSNSKRSERFFWQYNLQAKGPKGQRLVIKSKLEDPHVLNEVTDPVFSPNCAVRGIKHSGKARKGDGNDLTPNARKLYSIGKELDKLGRIINDMTPVSELPFNARPKTRKEKNKLASRACRLKKKAQHEANKIKLYGLEHEHRRLINGIEQTKQILITKFTETPSDKQEELTNRIDNIAKFATKVKIADHSTEYVNKVLERAKNGVPGGGLDEF